MKMYCENIICFQVKSTSLNYFEENSSFEIQNQEDIWIGTYI